MLRNIELEFDCEVDTKYIKLLYDITFGNDYISENQLIAYINHPDRYIVSSICHKGLVIGFSVQEIVALDKIAAPQLADLLKKQHNSPLWIQRKHTLLAKAYRGMGIGSKLIQHTETKCSAYELPIFSLIWDYQGNHIKHKLAQLHYNIVHTFQDYWYKDSLTKQYQCVLCGNPCHCNATLAVKTL